MPESFRAETTVPPRAHRPSFSQDAVELIRRREVTRVLRKMNASPDEEEAIERLSQLLVTKLLLGPISEAMTHRDLGLPTVALISRLRRAYERVEQGTDDP